MACRSSTRMGTHFQSSSSRPAAQRPSRCSKLRGSRRIWAPVRVMGWGWIMRGPRAGGSEDGARHALLGQEILQFLVAADGHTDLLQHAALQAVDPAMDREGLATPPGIEHDGGAAYVQHLLDDVELAEPVQTRLLVGPDADVGLVLLGHVFHVAQPVVDEPQGGVAVGSLHAAT